MFQNKVFKRSHETIYRRCLNPRIIYYNPENTSLPVFKNIYLNFAKIGKPSQLRWLGTRLILWRSWVRILHFARIFFLFSIFHCFFCHLYFIYFVINVLLYFFLYKTRFFKMKEVQEFPRLDLDLNQIQIYILNFRFVGEAKNKGGPGG